MADNFSKYASSYDEYAGVQNEAAGMLARRLPCEGITKILEIGCGTGNYTALLSSRFGNASIRAIDISGPMVDVACRKFAPGRVLFETADARSVEFGRGYDLVTSSAVFHWLGGLDGIIKKAERALSGNGLLAFSAFGPMTFAELKASLASATSKDAAIASDIFPRRADIEGALQKHFRKANITERLIRESYPSLTELLRKIKYSGTRGSGSEVRNVWSPDLLKKIEKKYLERFGSIEATYQVFFCEAAK